jgi:hypothetical protein
VYILKESETFEKQHEDYYSVIPEKEVLLQLVTPAKSREKGSSRDPELFDIFPLSWIPPHQVRGRLSQARNYR